MTEISLLELDKYFLGRERDFEKDKLGIYSHCLRGYSKNTRILGSSTSGGMVSSLLICALEEGIIDAVLLAGWREDKPWLCKPFIATNKEEVLKGIITGMMIVPINSLLNEVVREVFQNCNCWFTLPYSWNKKVAKIWFTRRNCKIH